MCNLSVACTLCILLLLFFPFLLVLPMLLYKGSHMSPPLCKSLNCLVLDVGGIQHTTFDHEPNLQSELLVGSTLLSNSGNIHCLGETLHCFWWHGDRHLPPVKVVATAATKSKAEFRFGCRHKATKKNSVSPDQAEEKGARTARTALCTAQAFPATLFCIFQFFSGWQGHGGLSGTHTTTEASTPASSPKVVVAAHTPCQGRAVGRGRRRCRTLWYGRSTEEPSAPQGAQACGVVSNASRFDVLLNGVPIPMMQLFRCAYIGSFRVSIVTT